MASKPLTGSKLPRIPSYCHHRKTSQAFVKIDGKFLYLGRYGSDASREAYASIVGSVLVGREVVPPRSSRQTPPSESKSTVREVCEKFKAYAKTYYVKNGQPTREAGTVENACDHAIALFGDQHAEAFGPLALKAVRERMVAKGLARSTVNNSVTRIRRAFKWAAAEELIPASVPTALATVPGLRAGRTSAREPKPVMPVAEDVVKATLAKLPEVVADMARLQRFTGMRPGEVIDLRPCDVDRSGDVWTYRPRSHKTQHHGRERVVYLGPKAQAILLRYLARDAESCCFQPADSESKRRSLAHAMRTTPLSCGNKPGVKTSSNPSRPASEKYDTSSYNRAIRRACEKAGVEAWTPNQLRHTAATEIRARFGLESAQTVLGHTTANMTERYAEKNQAAGAAVARAIG